MLCFASLGARVTPLNLIQSVQHDHAVGRCLKTLNETIVLLLDRVDTIPHLGEQALALRKYIAPNTEGGKGLALRRSSTDL